MYCISMPASNPGGLSGLSPRGQTASAGHVTSSSVWYNYRADGVDGPQEMERN